MAGVRPQVTNGPPARRAAAAGRPPKVVVIGGGIAGVSAAMVLAERGVPVVLCEAGDRLGGRLGRTRTPCPTAPCSWLTMGFTASSASTTTGGACWTASARPGHRCFIRWAAIP